MKIEIVNVKKVKLNPGDTLVFELETPLPKPLVERYSHDLKGFFPEQKILVLSRGITLKKVLKEGEKI
jgi:hypothetical protein